MASNTEVVRPNDKQEGVATPPRHSRRSAALAAAFAVSVVGVFSLAVWAGKLLLARGTSSAFPIVPSADDLNRKVIWASSDSCFLVHLRNTSAERVHLASLKPTCTCTSVEPSCLDFSPIEERAVTVKLSTNPLPADRPESKLEVALVPTIARFRGRPPRWELAGLVRTLLSLSESHVEFDGPLVEGQVFASRTIEIRSEIPLKSLKAEGGSDIALLDMTRKSDMAYVLRIEPKRNLRTGEFRFDVPLLAVMPSGNQWTFKMLTVAWRIARDINVSPRRIVFARGDNRADGRIAGRT